MQPAAPDPADGLVGAALELLRGEHRVVFVGVADREERRAEHPVADAGVERVLAAEIVAAVLVAHLDDGHQVVAVEDDVARIVVVRRDVGEPFDIAAEPVARILRDQRIDALRVHLLAHGRPAPFELLPRKSGSRRVRSRPWRSPAGSNFDDVAHALGSPATKARRLSMRSGITCSAYSSLMPPTWDVIMRFGVSQSGLDGGSGSFWNTSSPAPAIRPSLSARRSASSSSTPPRAMLISTPSGFMAPSTVAVDRCGGSPCYRARARSGNRPAAAASAMRARGWIASKPGAAVRPLLTPITRMPNT